MKSTKTKTDIKIKKPMNAWTIFLKERCDNMKKKNTSQNMELKKLVKIISAEWKCLTLKEKEKYFEKAHIKSINHKNKCEELKSKAKSKAEVYKTRIKFINRVADEVINKIMENTSELLFNDCCYVIYRILKDSDVIKSIKKVEEEQRINQDTNLTNFNSAWDMIENNEHFFNKIFHDLCYIKFQ